MKVIFAQGNPGSRYAKTRHNVGWQFLDSYAKSKKLKFAAKPKFMADVAEITTADGKALLVKPMTFYNQTGQSARAIADFYKLEAGDFLIVCDDLALPIGTIRTRIGGSSAGNNGIKSLNAHLGEATARARIGTYNQDLPAGALANVLGKFSRKDAAVIKSQTDTVADIIDSFIDGNFTTTTHKAAAD